MTDATPAPAPLAGRRIAAAMITLVIVASALSPLASAAAAGGAAKYVTFTAPNAGATVARGADTTFSVTAECKLGPNTYPATAFTWDFGDAVPVVGGSSIVYAFAASVPAGPRTVTVIASGFHNGCQPVSTEVLSITIANAAPTVTLDGPTATLDNIPAVFTASGADFDGSIASYQWTIDSAAQPETGATLARTFAPGTYTVGVRAVDDLGSTSDASSMGVTSTAAPVIPPIEPPVEEPPPEEPPAEEPPAEEPPAEEPPAEEPPAEEPPAEEPPAEEPPAEEPPAEEPPAEEPPAEEPPAEEPPAEEPPAEEPPAEEPPAEEPPAEEPPAEEPPAEEPPTEEIPPVIPEIDLTPPAEPPAVEDPVETPIDDAPPASESEPPASESEPPATGAAAPATGTGSDWFMRMFESRSGMIISGPSTLGPGESGAYVFHLVDGAGNALPLEAGFYYTAPTTPGDHVITHTQWGVTGTFVVHVPGEAPAPEAPAPEAPASEPPAIEPDTQAALETDAPVEPILDAPTGGAAATPIVTDDETDVADEALEASDVGINEQESVGAGLPETAAPGEAPSSNAGVETTSASGPGLGVGIGAALGVIVLGALAALGLRRKK